MKNIFKIALITSLVIGLNATNYELATMYKDSRAMGMGATGVAIGGKASSTLLNPAGLAKVSNKNALGFAIPKLNIGTNEFIKDVALGKKESPTVSNIADILGKNINLNENLMIYLAGKVDNITSSLILVQSLNTNIKVHSGFGPAGLLELDVKSFVAPMLSTSLSVARSLHVGASLKYVGAYALHKNITLAQVQESDFSEQLKSDIGVNDPLAKLKYGYGLDLGLIYDLDDLRRHSQSRLFSKILNVTNPSFGFSILNIGDETLHSNLPQIMNAGIAIRPYCAWFREMVISAELHDIISGYDVNKSRGLQGKFRAGLEGYVIKNIVMDLALRGGWYNGAYTAGADFRLAMIHLGFATYVEELGGYIGQAQDRRYMVNLDINF